MLTEICRLTPELHKRGTEENEGYLLIYKMNLPYSSELTSVSRIISELLIVKNLVIKKEFHHRQKPNSQLSYNVHPCANIM